MVTSRIGLFYTVLSVCAVLAVCHNHRNVSVCVPATQTSQALTNCTRILGAANTADVSFTCISGGSTENCYRLLGDGKASLAIASGEDVFTANLDYGVIPILGESYRGRDDNTAYYSVAVVNKDFCSGPNKTLADLKGLRSSHTGYGRTAGWNYVVGSLLASEAMPLVSSDPDVADDAESVASFFSKVCAPRSSAGALAANNLPVATSNGTGAQYPGLCSACIGTCDSRDPYWNYEGVVRALMEDAADVGFTNHTVFINYTSDGTQAQNWSTKAAADFRLLCRNGGCAELTSYRTCHLARGPSRAIVATPLLGKPANASLFAAIQSALVAAARNSTFLRRAHSINRVPNFLIGGNTNRLTPFNTGLRGYFEKETLDSLQALNQIPTFFNGSGNATNGRFSFCTNSDGEQQFCSSVARLLNTTSLGFAWKCARPLRNSSDCAADVAAGHTDALVTGATGLYAAYRDYQLRAVAAEDSGSGAAAQYYSLAIVNQSYCDTPDAAKGLAGLADKAVCMTGYGRTAGWMMPLGYLAEKGLLNTSNLNSSISGDAQAAERFFGRICAAGNNTEGPMKMSGSNRTQPYAPLCTACASPRRCSSSDSFYDYEGAFRGIVEGNCTAALTRDGIVTDYSQGGRYAQAWAPRKDEYRLLCPGGGCSNVEDYEECTAAKVPSRAVVVRPGFGKVRELQEALETITRTPSLRSQIFSTTNNPRGYLFQNNVQSFVPVEGTTLDFLGAAGRAIQGIANLNNGARGLPLSSASAPAIRGSG